MASSSNFQHVSLTENDVPGAKLSYSMVEKHSMVQLKKWLHCRNLKCSGNKSELVKRVVECIEADKDTAISVSVDGGKWYDKKLLGLKQQNEGNTSICNAAIPPISGWNTFPSVSLPKHFNHGHIHHHIVESVQFMGQAESGDLSDEESDIEDLHTAKPMKKGEHYFTSGHVQGMKDTYRNGIYFLKAIVLASYDTTTSYNVLIQISQESGFIKDGTCTCAASGMGRCSHVTAVLLALKDFIEKFGIDFVSSTSKLCEWNKGRTKKKNPQNVTSANYLSAKKRKVDSIIHYNPTPTMQAKPEEEVVANFLSAVESGSGKPTMWESLLYRQYNEYSLSNDEKYNLKENVNKCVSFLSVSTDTVDSPTEIVNTQGSSEWINERRVRVTASDSKTISNVKSVRSVSNILKRKLWEEPVHTKGMQHGVKNEKKAFMDYESKLKSADDSSKVQTTGLWVNSEYPQIGASPDGLVYDPSEKSSDGLLEIKCPFVLHNKTVKDFNTILTQKQLNNFCLKKISNEIVLKHNHAYFFQIQTQLGVLGKEWCDLIVWGSENNFVLLRVRFDKDFWNSLKNKLLSFHHSWLIPELFEMRVPRRLLHRQIV